MPVGDFPTVFSTIMKCWLNSMVTSENGLVHTYMRCMYVQLQPCTYISDVSKRGVLGSADDDIAFFLHIVTFFNWSWVDPLFFIVFSLFWRCASLFFIVFFQLYGTTESYNVTLVERHGFQKKKRVPREKSGRHSNLVYLVPKPLLKNPGRHSVIFQYFEDVFHYCSMFFILKMVFIDVSLFWRCCSLFFNDSSLFSRCV